VRRALKEDLDKLLDSGPVCAVLDRDKAHKLWPDKCPTCLTGLCAKLRAEAPGKYELVWLIQNVETLTDAAASALGKPPPSGKPSPNERDRLLNEVAWAKTAVRETVCNEVPSFARLVKWVTSSLPK